MCVLGENCDSRHSHEISIKTVTYMAGPESVKDEEVDDDDDWSWWECAGRP